MELTVLLASCFPDKCVNQTCGKTRLIQGSEEDSVVDPVMVSDKDCNCNYSLLGYVHAAVKSDLNPICLLKCDPYLICFWQCEQHKSHWIWHFNLSQATFKCGTELDTYQIFLNATAIWTDNTQLMLHIKTSLKYSFSFSSSSFLTSPTHKFAGWRHTQFFTLDHKWDY